MPGRAAGGAPGARGGGGGGVLWGGAPPRGGGGPAGGGGGPLDHAVAQTCKPWPYDPSIRLAAIAFASDAATEAGERNLE
ncbi:hypothetical protein Q6A20_10560, partial [Xanthomonas euvesicatoria pv. eucalypti]|nr:hypothetical protein [Xanthomonas euvesicatoria pv. eucalypti]